MNRGRKLQAAETPGRIDLAHTVKIISGGQTGVDRGALDAALELDVACGGHCPKGRLAEDGEIPERYPLEAIESTHYPDRTLKNVQDSDGTLVVHFGVIEGGTAFTLKCCETERKPHVAVDTSTADMQQTVVEIAEFVRDNKIEVLNVAGPRASKVPDARRTTYTLLRNLIEELQTADSRPQT